MLSASACGEEKQAIDPARAQQHASPIEAYNSFGMDMYLEAAADASHNVVLSPLSMAMALSMTMNGAKGGTLDEMQTIMQVGDIASEIRNSGNKELMSKLEDSSADIELSIANSLWIRAGSNVYKDFKASNEQHYNALVSELDFDTPSSVNAINNWVKEATGEKISHIIEDPIDQNTLMFLINALYFKGDWRHKFLRMDTTDQPFRLLDGSSITVPMMEQTKEFPYLKAEAFQAIRLAYVNENWNMILVLPNDGIELSEVQEKWLKDLSSWREGFQTSTVKLGLPRFKVEFQLKMKDTLQAMGMETAFDREDADFSGIAPIPPNIYLDNVMHKAFIEVSETGTTAAAVSSSEFKELSGISSSIAMTFDRPFFFAIEEKTTGMIAFMGSIMNPLQ
nr:serpin family protein [Paenibacillus oenotherae]